MEAKKQQIVEIADLLLQKQRKAESAVTDIIHLAGDGSQRIFYRLKLNNDETIVAVLPNYDSPFGLQEADSAWHICCHLRGVNVTVPEPLAYDGNNGLILFEDLGDLRLHDFLSQHDFLREDCRFNIYRDVVRQLVKMQIDGREGFQTSWCWQTSCYDRQLMLERESAYFLKALCQDFFHLNPDIDTLNAEFVQIAETASLAPADYFLHRDFQSRNIMVEDGLIRIIDFQGGRLGPLGYDLASLLIDPYVGLSTELQEAIYDEYFAELVKRIKYNPVDFRREFVYLAMQRNLQILGAFAFLGKQKKKTFFLAFVQPALLSLHKLLQRSDLANYPVLYKLVETCLEKTNPTKI